MIAHSQDPTIQSPFAPDHSAVALQADHKTDHRGDHWDVSRSEIEAMARKAARAVGYHWGLAEEAGRATRILAGWGLPAPALLLDVLKVVDGNVARHAPTCAGGAWRSANTPMCPITAGAALSDRIDHVLAGMSITLEGIASAPLLLPFLWRAAVDLGCCLSLEGDGFEVICLTDGIILSDPQPPPVTAPLTLQVAHTTGPGRAATPPNSARCAVDLATWRALDALALRTCVPASEASRAGAGAGVRDND